MASSILKNKNNIDGVVDLDLNNIDYSTSVIYSARSVNGPAGITTNAFFVSLVRGTLRKQFYSPYNANRCFIRTMYDGVWTNWREITID